MEDAAAADYLTLMPAFETAIGLVAAFFTTFSYVPQVRQCWRTGSARDLSLGMLVTLAAGIALWLVYGVLKDDVVLVAANGVSFALLGSLLAFKLRENGRAAKAAA